MAPNRTNLGLFQIKFQNFLKQGAWILSTLIWKVLDLSHLGPIWPILGSNLVTLLSKVRRERSSAYFIPGICEKVTLILTAKVKVLICWQLSLVCQLFVSIYFAQLKSFNNECSNNCIVWIRENWFKQKYPSLKEIDPFCDKKPLIIISK